MQWVEKAVNGFYVFKNKLHLSNIDEFHKFVVLNGSVAQPLVYVLMATYKILTFNKIFVRPTGICSEVESLCTAVCTNRHPLYRNSLFN